MSGDTKKFDADAMEEHESTASLTSADAVVHLDDEANASAPVVITATDRATGEGGKERPKVTFMGNSYDVTSLGALASGILVLLSCLTCGQIFYCLPVLPVVLGIVGLVMAKQSIDPERTRLWSWLGIGGGGIALIVLAFAIVAYFGFVVFVAAMGIAGNTPTTYQY